MQSDVTIIDGGGYHGNNALKGKFLGGCIHSGRCAGRAAGKEKRFIRS